MTESKYKHNITMYTDGSCSSLGVGGYGIIIEHNGVSAEFSGCYRLTTIARMEMTAIIKGLELLREPCRVSVYCDNFAIIKAAQRRYARKWLKGERHDWENMVDGDAPNLDLWGKIEELRMKHSVSFFWIKGHNGHDENTRCDKLATEASRLKKDMLIDYVYEEGKIKTV